MINPPANLNDGVRVPLMPTTTNKQRVLAHLFTALKKRYSPTEPEARPAVPAGFPC